MNLHEIEQEDETEFDVEGKTTYINSREFAKGFSLRYGIPFNIALHKSNMFWELFRKILYEDKDDISIYRLGAFKHVTRAARKVIHPTSKQLIELPEKTIVRFYQAKTSFGN